MKVNRGGAVYVSSILVLLLSSALLLHAVQTLQADIRANSFVPPASALREALSATMRTTDGQSVVLGSVPRRYLVLFFFTVSDCPSCLGEMTDLNRIAGFRSDMQVFAILAFGNTDEARQTQRNFGFSYPVLQDETGYLQREFHLPETPWKIVIDRRERRIVYQDPPGFTPAEREAFTARMNQLGH